MIIYHKLIKTNKTLGRKILPRVLNFGKIYMDKYIMKNTRFILQKFNNKSSHNIKIFKFEMNLI